MGCGSSSDIDAKTVFLEASRLPFGGTTHASSGRLQGLVFNRCYKPPPSPATPPLGAHADLLAASMSQASLSTSRDEAGCSTHAAHNRSTGADPNAEGGDMRRVSPRSLRRHKKQAHQQQMAAYKLMLKNVSKEELLAKVIEMEPTYAEAWSMLGECIQQRGGKEALTPVYLPSVFSEMITFCPGAVQASIPLPLMKKAREVAAERSAKDKHREETSSMYEEGRDRPQELLMDGVGGRGLGEGGSGNHSHSPPRSVTRGGPSVPVSPNASLTSASLPVTPSSSRSAQIQARERPSPPPALASGHRVSPSAGALPPAARVVDASDAGPGQAYHSADHQTSISPPPGAAGESVASSSIGLAHLRGVNTSGAFAAAADVDGSGAPYVLTDLSSRGAAAGNDGTHTAGNGSFGVRSFDKESNGRQSPGLALSGAVLAVSQADASPVNRPPSAVVNAPSAESIPSPDPADYEHMILYQIATIFTVLHEHDTTLRIEEEEELIMAGFLRPEDASFDCNAGDRADEPTCSGSGLRRAQSAREHRQSGQSMAAAVAVNGNTTANAPPLSSRRSSTARGGSRPTPPSMPSTKAVNGKHLQGLGVLFDNFIFVDRVICAAKAYLLQPHNTTYQLKLAVALLEDRVLYQPRDHPIPPSPREAVLICQRLLTALAEATPFDAVVWHWLGRTLRHDQVVHLAVPPIPRSILCGEVDASPSTLNGAKPQEGDRGASKKTNGRDDQATVEQLLFARRSCLVRSIEVDTTGSLPTNYDVLAAEMAPGEVVELPKCPKRRRDPTHNNNGAHEAPASVPRTRTPGRSESPGQVTIHSGDNMDHMDEQAQLRAALYGSFDDQQVQLLGLQLDSRTAMGWVTLGATLDDEEAIDVSLPSGEVVCMNQTQCFLMSVAQEPSYQAWWNLALSCGVLREPRSTFDAPSNGETTADAKNQNDERSLADETHGTTTLNPTRAFAENDDDDDDAIAHESTECQRLAPNLTTTVSEGLAGTKPGRDVSVADIVVSDRTSNNDNNENASSMDSYGLPPEELTMAIHRLRELDDELLISVPKSAKPNAGLFSKPSDPNASPHDGRGQQQRLIQGAPAAGAGHGLGSSTTSINVDGGVAAGRGIRSRRASTVSVSAAGGVQGLPGFTTVVNTSVASTGAAKTDRSALSLHRRMSSSLSAIGGGPSLGTSAAVPLSQLSIATSTGGVGGGAGQDRRFQSNVEASAARSAVANTTAGGGGGGRYFGGSNSGVDDDLGGLAIASVAATPLAGRRATLSPPPPFGHPGQSAQGGERGANGHLSTTPPLVDMVSPTGGAEPSDQQRKGTMGRTSDTSKAAGAATGDATAVFSQSNTAPPMSDAGQSPLQVPSASTHSVAPPPLPIGAAGLGAPNGEPSIPVSVSSPDYGRVRPAHARSPPRSTAEASSQQRHDTSTTPTPKHATRDSSNHNHYLRGNESPSRQSMSPSPSRQPTSGTGHVGQCRSRSVSPPPGSVSVARSGGAFSNNSSFQRPLANHPQTHPLVPNLSLGHAGGPRGSFGVSATPEGLSLPSSSRSRRFGGGGGGGANANNNNPALLHHVGSGLSAASLGGVSGGGHAAAFVGTSSPPIGLGNGSGELASLLGKQLVSRPGSSRAMTGRGGPGAARDSGTGALGVVRSSMVSAIAMGDAPWSSVDAGEFDAGAAFAHNRGVLLDVCVKGQLDLLSDEGSAGDGGDEDDAAAAATRADDFSEANAGQKKGTISNEKDQKLQQGRQRILAPVLLRQSFGDDRPGFTQLECLIYALECDNGQAEAWRALGHVLLSFQAVRKGARSDALFAAEPHGPALDPTSLAAATKSSTSVDDRQAQRQDRYPSQFPDAGGGDAQANGQTAQSMIHRVNGGNDKDALRSVSDVEGIGGGAGIGSPNHQSMQHAAASSTTTTTAPKKVPETAVVEEVLMVHVGCEAVDADVCFAKAATLQNHPMR